MKKIISTVSIILGSLFVLIISLPPRIPERSYKEATILSLKNVSLLESYLNSDLPFTRKMAEEVFEDGETKLDEHIRFKYGISADIQISIIGELLRKNKHKLFMLFDKNASLLILTNSSNHTSKFISVSALVFSEKNKNIFNSLHTIYLPLSRGPQKIIVENIFIGHENIYSVLGIDSRGNFIDEQEGKSFLFHVSSLQGD